MLSLRLNTCQHVLIYLSRVLIAQHAINYLMHMLSTQNTNFQIPDTTSRQINFISQVPSHLPIQLVCVKKTRRRISRAQTPLNINLSSENPLKRDNLIITSCLIRNGSENSGFFLSGYMYNFVHIIFVCFTYCFFTFKLLESIVFAIVFHQKKYVLLSYPPHYNIIHFRFKVTGFISSSCST